jgi:hypothetical protein
MRFGNPTGGHRASEWTNSRAPPDVDRLLALTASSVRRPDDGEAMAFAISKSGSRSQHLGENFRAATPGVLASFRRVLDMTVRLNNEAASRVLDEVEAISIIGADPNWQISELEKILRRWGRSA